MSKLYLVPDRKDMERMCGLAAEYGCAFEYNDFYIAKVMDDAGEQERIITDYRRYRKECPENNFPERFFSADTMHGAFLDVTIHSDDPLIRDASMLRVRQSMEIAKNMGLKGVVFHTGRLAGFRAPDYLRNWRDRNEAFFTEIAHRYPAQQIYMENMFDEAPDILAGLAEKMRDVKNFGVCLDYAHAMLSKCPGREWIEALAPYIRHMHINDNDLQNDLHLAVGAGKLDWQEFDHLIRQYRVEAPVLVEVSGYEAQRESLQYMKHHGIYPMEREGEDQNASAI
ncbi:MAG: sugar phosphate isomerase/epimerase [Lachnospiraceae bacterium]|nr:sugar phosphate isomerase/epimerase [Lachnospiraceae bacterium]